MNQGLLGFPRGQTNRAKTSTRRPHSPELVSDLTLWLDATQLTGLADGDALATWNDLSGQGASFTQATSGSRPLYKTNQINGLPAIQFNGSTHSLTSNSASPVCPFTVFAVVKASSLSNGTFWGSTPLYGFLSRYNASKYELLSSYTALVGQSTSNTDTNAHILIFSYDSKNWTFQKDGNTDGGGVNQQIIAPGTNVLGRDGYGGSGYWGGVIAELISYGRILTATERRGITNYLKAKYGI